VPDSVIYGIYTPVCSGGSRILKRGLNSNSMLAKAVHRGASHQSLHTKRGKIFFAFIFHLSGWALVALSCFARQVPELVMGRAAGFLL